MPAGVLIFSFDMTGTFIYVGDLPERCGPEFPLAAQVFWILWAPFASAARACPRNFGNFTAPPFSAGASRECVHLFRRESYPCKGFRQDENNGSRRTPADSGATNATRTTAHCGGLDKALIFYLNHLYRIYYRNPAFYSCMMPTGASPATSVTIFMGPSPGCRALCVVHAYQATAKEPGHGATDCRSPRY